MRKRICKIGIALAMSACLLVTQTALAQDKAQTASTTDMQYFQGIMDMIKEKHQGDVTDKKLLEGMLKGAFGSMDPYTEYFTKEEAANFFDDLGGSYEGIGISMSKEGDYITVIKVFSGSPAEKAGMVSGDKIVEADGKKLVGSSVEEAVKLLKGKSGTKVKISIVRNGVNEIKSFEVERAPISINPVTYEIKGDIGYIRIDSFNSNTAKNFLAALKEIDNLKINKLILDLRDDPGGEVGQCVQVAKQLVPKGVITKLDFKSEDVEDEIYYSELEKTKYKLAVLVNGGSASASEILGGAIQDTKAGTLIGTKTYGKGVVQQFFPILTFEAYSKYKSQLGVDVVSGYDLMSKYKISPVENEVIGWAKITTAQYLTPNGRMIDHKGLTPDIVLENPNPVKNVDITSIQKLALKVKPGLDGEGMDVYNAEKILKLSGYELDPPDFKLDQKTYAAIAKFQKDSGLYPYGVLDFTTQQKLNGKMEKLKLELDKQYAKAVEILNN